MKLKMLVGMAGVDFSLSPGDETDRFDDAEAGRLIEHGFAEKAAAAPAKKPSTKAEWDDERNKMLAERAKEQAEYEAFKAREAALLQTIDDLNAFKASVASIVGTVPATDEVTMAETKAATLSLSTLAAATAGETTDKAKAPETR